MLSAARKTRTNYFLSAETSRPTGPQAHMLIGKLYKVCFWFSEVVLNQEGGSSLHPLELTRPPSTANTVQHPDLGFILISVKANYH